MSARPPLFGRRTWVLALLENTNRALGRPATANEMAARMRRLDLSTSFCISTKELGQAFSRDLFQLWMDDAVYCTGKRGHARVFCTLATLPDPPMTFSPGGTSHRKLVLAAVAKAVERLGRPVRLQDIVDELPLSRNTTSVYIASLTRSGELTAVGWVCGEGGNRLVVPTGTDVTKLTPTVPPTLNEVVAATFAQIWEEHIEQARRIGGLPVPIAGKEVTERVGRKSPATKLPSIRMALKALTRGHHHQVRRVGTGEGCRTRWAPADVPDTDLDLSDTQAAACRSDPARIELLIRRATGRHGVPAVSSRQLNNELHRDVGFRLQAPSLADAITIACPRPERSYTLKNPLVLRAGVVGDVPYYCLPAAAANAALYLEWLQADHAWTQFDWKGLIQAAGRCQLPAYAAAHLALLPGGIQEVRATVSRVLEQDALGEQLHGAMRARLQELDNLVLARPGLFQRHHDSGPEKPTPTGKTPPRWTPEEFARTFQMLTGRPPTGQEALHPLIRRVPNPAYRSTGVRGRKHSVQWHLDRTSALLFLAERFGGRVCRVLAELARNELASVRDPQPAIVSLGSEEPDHRLAAVACLAFLWGTRSAHHLLTTIEVEPEPGVREAALWAYGFAGSSTAADEVLRRHAASDPSPQVRQFAALALEAPARESTRWWIL
jgi:hypothetical protein